MGCGCGSKAVNQQRGTRAVVASSPSAETMYEVLDSDGSLVASYSNPVTARAEARRIGGIVSQPQSSATLAGITAAE